MTFAKTFWGQTDAHKPAPPGKEEMQTVPANLGKKAFLSIFSSFAFPHKRRNDFLRWQDNGHGVPQRFIPPWVECSTPTAGPAPQGTFSTPTCSGRGAQPLGQGCLLGSAPPLLWGTEMCEGALIPLAPSALRTPFCSWGGNEMGTGKLVWLQTPAWVLWAPLSAGFI